MSVVSVVVSPGVVRRRQSGECLVVAALLVVCVGRGDLDDGDLALALTALAFAAFTSLAAALVALFWCKNFAKDVRLGVL